MIKPLRVICVGLLIVGGFLKNQFAQLINEQIAAQREQLKVNFIARPEENVRCALAWVENKLRQANRMVKAAGLGKSDVYKGPAK